METVLNNELLWTALATVIAVSVAGAALALAAKYAAGWSREAWDRIRGQVPAVIELVNEPDDPLIVMLDKYIPGEAAPIMSRAFPVFLRTLADEIDKHLLASEAIKAP